MNISSGNNFSSISKLKNRNNVNFGYHIYVDTGASKPDKGSLKASIESDHGDVLFTTDSLPDGPLKEVYPPGFRNSNDFINGISDRIKQFIAIAHDKIKNLPDIEDRKLSGLAVAAPSQIIGKFSRIIGNLVDQDGFSLTNVNFKNIEENLKASPEIEFADNFKYVAANDMCGCAAAVAQKLANDPLYAHLFDRGLNAVVCMTGGGLGVTNIKVKDDIFEIEATGNEHYKAFGDKTFGTYGASVPALIRNYAESLNLEHLNDIAIEKLAKTGNLKILTDYPIIVKEDSYEYKVLKDTQLFEAIPEDDPENVYLKLRGTDEKQQRKAAEESIKKYIEALGKLASFKLTDGLNLLVLTGNGAENVRKYIAKHPIDGNKSLEMLIEKEAIAESIERTEINAQEHGFKVITCFDIKNNTAGGRLLLKGKFIGEDHRSSWVNIPVKELKEANPET